MSTHEKEKKIEKQDVFLKHKCTLNEYFLKNITLTLYSIDTHFDASTTDSFLKHCGKKEKLLVTSNFSFFQQCFQLNQIIVYPFVHI